MIDMKIQNIYTFYFSRFKAPYYMHEYENILYLLKIKEDEEFKRRH